MNLNCFNLWAGQNVHGFINQSHFFDYLNDFPSFYHVEWSIPANVFAENLNATATSLVYYSLKMLLRHKLVIIQSQHLS